MNIILNKLNPEFGELDLDATINISVNPSFLFSIQPSILNPTATLSKLNVTINGVIYTDINVKIVDNDVIIRFLKQSKPGIYKIGLVKNNDIETISNELDFKIRSQLYSINTNNISIIGHNDIEIRGKGFNETTIIVRFSDS